MHNDGDSDCSPSAHLSGPSPTQAETKEKLRRVKGLRTSMRARLARVRLYTTVRLSNALMLKNLHAKYLIAWHLHRRLRIPAQSLIRAADCAGKARGWRDCTSTAS